MLYEKKIQKKGFDAFEKFKTRTGTEASSRAKPSVLFSQDD